jgi:tetratricopeptide (TPR) repeat protein
MKVRLWSFLIIFLSITSLAHAQSTSQISLRESKAQQHFERAIQLDIFDDPYAEKEYRLAIKSSNGFYPEAWKKLAQFLQHQLRFSEAAEALENYINQTPEDDHSYSRKNLMDLNQIVILQKRLASSDPPSLEDLLKFIPLIAGFGKQEDAIPYAEKTIILYPTSNKAHLALSRLLPTNQKERQFELIKKAVELDPTDPEAHTELGGYYFLPVGDLPESIKEFRKALEVSNGQYANAWQGLGRALAACGMKKEAIEAFQNYLRTRKSPSPYDNDIKREIDELTRNR